MCERRVLVFPEVKEVSYKDGEIIIDEEYRVVLSGDAAPLEAEAADGVARIIERLTGRRPQVVDVHHVSGKEKVILVGTSFRDMLTSRLDRSEPEGYVLEVSEERIILCGNDASGTFYAGETLKQLFRVRDGRLYVPRVTIKDWPDYRYRGLYVESKWGPDLMTLDDWRELIDFMASIKLNFLDIGVYGCWTIQYENQITEFMMVPVRAYPRLRTPKTIRYYSPLRKGWVSITYLPRIFSEDFFSEIIAYGKRRNVTVRPAFNSLGHNTLIPREYPEVSSIDEEGNPTHYGFCLTNPKTLRLMFEIYDEIIERYLKPNGVDTFNIELDEVYAGRGKDPKDPKKLVDPWCRCLRCSGFKREDLFLEYVVNLIRHLAERGMKKVSLWNDQITRMGLLERFAARLKEENLIDKVAINWWYYGPDEESLETERFDRGRFGSELGLTRWVTPMAGYFFWWLYQSLLRNIFLMLRRGFKQEAEGTVAYCTFDYSFHRNYYCLSDFSWNQTKERDLNQFDEKYAKAVFGEEWEKGLKALEELEKIASAGSETNRFLSNLFYYPYSYVHPERKYPRSYPQEVIDNLKGDQKVPLSAYLDRIRELHETARRAKELFLSINNVKTTASPRLLEHYIVECERYETTLKVYLLIFRALNHYKGAKENQSRDRDKTLKNLDEAVSSIDEALNLQETMMLNIERTKSHYLLPQTMRDLTFMRTFLVDLRGKLRAARERYLKGMTSELPPLDF